MSTEQLSLLSVEQLSQKLQTKEIDVAQFQAALQKQQDAERAKGNVGIASIKVSDKQALSVKLRSQTRFPTTLYAFQWLQLLTNVNQIIDGLYANRTKLSFKDGQSLPDRAELVAEIVSQLQSEAA